jgi:cell division protein FtsB
MAHPISRLTRAPGGEIQKEEEQNQQLLALSARIVMLTTQIHSLTSEVHQLVTRSAA